MQTEMKLNTMLKKSTRIFKRLSDEARNAAMKYSGIPFVWMGRSFDGCDCLGLLYLWCLNEYNQGLVMVDNEGSQYDKVYEKSPDDRLMGFLLSVGEYRPSPEFGDILMFGNKHVTHCGIYLENGAFLHQLRESNKSHLSDMNDCFMYYRGSVRIKRK